MIMIVRHASQGWVRVELSSPGRLVLGNLTAAGNRQMVTNKRTCYPDDKINTTVEAFMDDDLHIQLMQRGRGSCTADLQRSA